MIVRCRDVGNYSLVVQRIMAPPGSEAIIFIEKEEEICFDIKTSLLDGHERQLIGR